MWDKMIGIDRIQSVLIGRKLYKHRENTTYIEWVTAFGRQGPEVQILSPRPLTDWFITLSTVANACFIYNSTGTVPRM